MGLETALATMAISSVAGGVIQGSAARSAARAQSDALRQVRPVDVNALRRDAAEADTAQYRGSFEEFSRTDPQAAAIRNRALGSLNAEDPSFAQNAGFLRMLDEEVAAAAPWQRQLAEASSSAALEDLRAGGRLSPDQQAELVRSGLAVSSAAGTPTGSSTAPLSVGRLLASESEALKTNRANRASALFGLGEAARTNRVNSLLTLGNVNASEATRRLQRDTSLAAFSDSMRPTIGLSGGDVANVAIANQNQANSAAMQQGQINANAAAARGQLWSGILGGLSSTVGTYAMANAITPANRTYNFDATFSDPNASRTRLTPAFWRG